MNSSWRPLPVAPNDNVPPLLVSTSFGPASYSVAVTDLARVWSESLDRRAICLRALQANTTIDPSYDNEQMGVFLGKLESVFSDSASEPSLSLASDTSGNDLVLHISCPLPGGLPPLTWSFSLALQEQSSISSLVQPLIQDRARSQRSSAALISALRQKDVVIAKLVEKLDSIGAGVESAFPSLITSGGGGTANSRRAAPRMTRADVERRIKGLKPFDESAFWSQQRQIASADDSTSSILSTFGELPCGVDSIETKESTSWWQNMGRVALTRIASATNSQSTLKSEENAKGPDDDGFQMTPSKATKNSDLSDPVLEPPSPTPLKSPTAKPAKSKGLGRIGRLGAIGKKKETDKEAGKETEKETEDETEKREISKPVSPPHATGAAADDDETASEAEPEAAETEEKIEKSAEKKKELGASAEERTGDQIGEKSETVTAVRPKTRGGLGRIGGKKEKKAEPTEESTGTAEATHGETEKKEEPTTDKNPEKEKEPAKRKIDASESPAASQPLSPAQPPRPPAETISETKRAEILQQAVAKNAAPLRKKRKF